MTDCSRHTPLISAALVAAGLAFAGWSVGHGIVTMKKADRFITVRGLTEREVSSDLAVWPLRFRATGDDLTATQAALEKQRATIIAFMTKQGFEAAELQNTSARVIDRQAQEYSNGPAPTRYILQGGVLLRTTKVALAETVSQQVQELVKQGITLTDESNCGNSPTFLFTKLNAIKPEMLAEATKNAREAAAQFAKDAGGEVGSIRNATQGYFSVSARDSSESSGDASGCGDGASLIKKLRVVTTIDYYLND